MNPLRRAFSRIVLACALATVACDDGNPIGPSNQPEIANLQDDFQFQASNLSNTTQTLMYTWQNSGTTANVNQSGQISGGSATLTIRDPSGTQVYTRSLATTGTFTSTNGTSGGWRIEVRLDSVTGTVNFRVQKP